MRGKTLIALVVALAVGFVLRPVIDWFGNQAKGGANVKCIAEGKACVGMKPSAVLYLDDDIGGALDITCGFTEPGAGAMRHMNIVELMRQDCPDAKYVISFSNGRRLTNAWVAGERIVRLDDYPRHAIDP
jgi:hypothetical protein